MADLTPLTYGKVIGRFLAIIGDTADASPYPDAVAPSGTITFTPTLSNFIKVSGATPTPATAVLRPIDVPIDTDGYLSWNGQDGVHLVATDDPVIATEFTYTVTFNLTYEGVSIPIPAKVINVPAGSTYDLST